MTKCTAYWLPNLYSIETITDVQKCWATSYGWCTKGQYVDLWKNGCSQEMLDRLQPDIEVSDW